MERVEYSTVEWSFEEETGIGRLTMDRPESLNALSDALIDDIIDGFEEFAAVDEDGDGVSVRAIVLEGAGDDAFCVGGDVKEIREKGSKSFPGATGKGNRLMDTIEEAGPPVIAKIDGYCLGGGMEIALACDFRFASERSTLGLPEVNIGIFPGSSGTQRLAQLVPPNRAKEIIMTGGHYSPVEFLDDGILDEVVPANELDQTVTDFASEIADRPPLAIRAIKDVVNNAREVGLQQGTRYATNAYLPLLETEDHETALDAALSDEEPDWVGR